jgi:hypothetical protein
MTRINCVPPRELTDKHLVAEYRELPRVYALAEKAVKRGERPDDVRNPERYTMGKGHVRFFYSRLGYITTRYSALITEMIRRGFKPQFRSAPLALRYIETIPANWWRDWEPNGLALEINRRRISERTTT